MEADIDLRKAPDLLLRGVAALSPASHDDIAGLVSKTRQDAAIPLLDGGPASVTSPGGLSIGQSCSARGAGLAGGRGSRAGEGQGSAMSTCLVAVRLPRAVPR